MTTKVHKQLSEIYERYALPTVVHSLHVQIPSPKLLYLQFCHSILDRFGFNRGRFSADG